MNELKVLDCTLRDGGYCNDWRFGYENIKKINRGLIEAGIDIIECGFLTNTVSQNKNSSKYSCFKYLIDCIPNDHNGKMFVAMINYGEFDINDIPDYDGSTVDGIRVAFHKRDMNEAMDFCEKIKEKGYFVFIQAMVSLCYSDEELLELIGLANKFLPYAFYIVDSFGVMKKKDLTRIFYLVDHNLANSVMVGFHSHNNLQLSFSNAQVFLNMQTNRDLLIDSTIFGMGRGAGNLNTELLVEYINDNIEKKYELSPILLLIDDVINDFYLMKYWGYSLPNYISAKYNTHPNYSNYLNDKNTLTIKDIDNIFGIMDDEKRDSFDKEYIESLYVQYMEKGYHYIENNVSAMDYFKEKTIILVAPGKSSANSVDIIKSQLENESSIVISINYAYKPVHPDYIFISNKRRYRELGESFKSKCIVTSNIPTDMYFYKANYMDLINDEEYVTDNAGLMAIKFLIMNKAKQIKLVGFDGYSHDDSQNYSSDDMTLVARNEILDFMNIGMSKILNGYLKKYNIEFLTTPKYLNIEYN